MAACTWLLVRDRGRGERTRAVWCVVPLTALLVNLHLYAVFVPAWAAALLAGAAWERWWWPCRRSGRRRTGGWRGTSCCCWLPAGRASPPPCCPASSARPCIMGRPTRTGRQRLPVGDAAVLLRRPAGPGGRVLVLVALPFLLGVGVLGKRLRPGEFLWLAGSALVPQPDGPVRPGVRRGRGPDAGRHAARRYRTGCWPGRRCGGRRRSCWAGRLPAGPRTSPGPISRWRPGSTASAGCPRLPVRGRRLGGGQRPPADGAAGERVHSGGYLEYRLGDRYQVLLDGRTQLFTPDFWRATYLGRPGPAAAVPRRRPGGRGRRADRVERVPAFPRAARLAARIP